MKYSIIIFTYNRAGFLPRSIGSALNLKGDFELIVVDDGSTDATADVVLSLGRHIKYIRQDHAGAPAARNTGLAAASGEYVIWLGDDDALKPYTLEEYDAALKQAPDLSFAYGAAEVHSAEEIRVRQYLDFVKDSALPLGDLLFEEQCPDGSSLVRKDVYDTLGGYNPAFARAQDYEFFSRLFRTRGIRIQRVPRPLYEYHLHGQGQLSGDGLGRDLRYDWAIADSILDAHYLHDIFPRWDLSREKTRADLLLSLAQRFRALGYTDRCLEFFEEVYALRPRAETLAGLRQAYAEKTLMTEHRDALLARKNAGTLAPDDETLITTLERLLDPLPLKTIPVPDALLRIPRKPCPAQYSPGVLKQTHNACAPRPAEGAARAPGEITVAVPEHAFSRTDFAESHPDLRIVRYTDNTAEGLNARMKTREADWLLLTPEGTPRPCVRDFLENALAAIRECPHANMVIPPHGGHGQNRPFALDVLETPSAFALCLVSRELWNAAGGFSRFPARTAVDAVHASRWHFMIKALQAGLRPIEADSPTDGTLPGLPENEAPWLRAVTRILFPSMYSPEAVLEAHAVLTQPGAESGLSGWFSDSGAGTAGIHLIAGILDENNGDLAGAKAAYLHAMAHAAPEDWQPFLRMYLLSRSLGQPDAARWRTEAFARCAGLKDLFAETPEARP